MLYYNSRTEAGEKFAEELAKYRYEDCAVLALSDGGVVIGAQIAAVLHCPLMFLLTKDITLPGEKTAVGVVDERGGFTYDDMFSTGQIDEIHNEYQGYLEEQKHFKWRELNRLMTDGGLVDPDILKNRHIIVVTDGLLNGTSLPAVANFLKPIKTKKLIFVTPYSTIAAVDKMHMLGDELHVGSVIDGTFNLDHYYEKNDIPPQEDIIKLLNEAILHWK